MKDKFPLSMRVKHDSLNWVPNPENGFYQGSVYIQVNPWNGMEMDGVDYIKTSAFEDVFEMLKIMTGLNDCREDDDCDHCAALSVIKKYER